MNKLPDGSGFFIGEVSTEASDLPPVRWNPYNKVVQDHRDGTIDHDKTNFERQLRGLPTPWTPEIAASEVHLPPIL